MATPSAKTEALGFLIGVLYYLWLGTIFVPLSSQSHDSWGQFAKSWTIRLIVSVVFLALTRRVLKIGAVDDIRVTPAPPQPVPVEDLAEAGDQSLDPPVPQQPQRRWQPWLILSAVALYWVLHSPWLAQQPWFGALIAKVVIGTIFLFSVACFAILWLPKPSDQPELLHIVPSPARSHLNGTRRPE